VPVSNGVATFTTTLLASGVGPLTARYEGGGTTAHASSLFDCVDAQVPMLARMFEKRLRGYRAIGSDTRWKRSPSHGLKDQIRPSRKLGSVIMVRPK
jgi:hypothetical protein